MIGNKLRPDEIDAMPRKELFINILTRDVSIKDCIFDLIDNSVDAYIRNDLKDRREIKINISKNEFVIYDNCGGIERDFLQKNVFRFGVEKLKRVKPTLGVYGIGLKRAILKFGRDIHMETDDGIKHCRLNLNVAEWIKSDKWRIPFESLDSQLSRETERHTKITIRDLYDYVRDRFDLDSFIYTVKESIHITYTYFISHCIDFYVNGERVEAYPLEIRSDPQFKPSRFKEAFNGVDADIICYIDPRKGRKAKELGQQGWNIFCNKRLILVEDTAPTSGWTGQKGELPKYHSIYNEFRGIVFIESADPSKLPLNTSKTGVDQEAPVYNDIRNLMIRTARPLINYLTGKYRGEKNELDEIEVKMEKETEAVGRLNFVPMTKVKVGSVFEPPPREEPRIRMTSISYKKPHTLVGKAKEYLRVRSNKEVGEKTFDYYVDLEGIEID